MELEQSVPMRNCKQGNLQLFSLVVELCLHIDTDSTGTLIQYSEERLMIEKSSHGHSLFFSPRKNIIPVINRTEISFTIHNVSKLNIFKNFE